MLSKDLGKCLSIIYDSFTDDVYSWSKAVGFPFEKLKSWLKDYYLMNRVLCINTPSIICSTDKGEVVGVCTIEDLNFPPYDNNPDNESINAMTNACETLLVENIRDIRNVKVAYISFICVHKDFRRRNIGDMLVSNSTCMLKEKGFKYIVAYCTSYRSRALFENNGYRYIGGINYQNFCMPDGSKPYISMPKDECSVMFIDL